MGDDVNNFNACDLAGSIDLLDLFPQEIFYFYLFLLKNI